MRKTHSKEELQKKLEHYLSQLPYANREAAPIVRSQINKLKRKIQQLENWR